MPTWPCDVCDVVRLTKGKSTGLLKKSCVCGERHRVCWDCCRQLAITGEWPFPVCPHSDEFKVVAAVMLEREKEPKAGPWAGLFPGRDQTEPDQGTKVEGL